MIRPDVRTPEELRQRLSTTHLVLVFTPGVCRPDRPPLEILEAALPSLDAIQVRIKHPVDARWSAPAAEAHAWTLAVLELLAARRADVLLFVNDRVDVARALAHRGVAGVHVGADDCPPATAREFLGAGPLLGLSTHSMGDVVAAGTEPVDYLGFGPVHATRTKEVGAALGPEAAWIAASGTHLPLFPIGGIDPINAGELARIGRAAVSAAILAADDPERAARLLRAELLGART